MIIWSFASFAFFMVPFYLTYVKANIFLLAISTDGAEILASLVCLCVTEVFDLKKALIMSCAVIATGALAMTFISEQMSNGQPSEAGQYFNVALILFTNFGIVCAFNIAYLINTQLFPTILLATAYGCCNILGRLITVSSPIVANI